MIDQSIIDDFYTTSWKSNIHLFRYSGDNLIEEIKAMDPKLVIDAGCGVNYFKNKIPNIIGFDPVFKEADIQCHIETAPFADKCADVVLALGSVNFGDRMDIAAKLLKLKSWLRPGGRLYMRGAPGDYTNDKGIVWFKWGTEEIYYFAELLGLVVERIQVEYNTEGVLKTRSFPHRYVWLYRRP